MAPNAAGIRLDPCLAGGRLTISSGYKIATVILLGDALEYFYHRLCHSVPLLWHVHAIHHTPIALSPGQMHEMKCAYELLHDITDAYVAGDKAYDAAPLVEPLERNPCAVVIPSKADRPGQSKIDGHLYKERHLVECFLQRIKRFRRISMRSKSSPQHSRVPAPGQCSCMAGLKTLPSSRTRSLRHQLPERIAVLARRRLRG